MNRELKEIYYSCSYRSAYKKKKGKKNSQPKLTKNLSFFFCISPNHLKALTNIYYYHRFRW